MISSKETTSIKAIAILMIVADHILDIFFQFNKTVCMLLGIGGSALFLFLSGYGIMTSYMSKGISLSYWKHKITRILVPYWVVTLCWILISGLFKSIGLKSIAKAMLVVDFDRKIDGTMWYLTFQIIWYIIFFLIFIVPSSKLNDLVKTLLLFVFSFGFYYCDHVNIFRNYTWQFTVNAFSLPLGVLLAYTVHRRILNITKMWRILLLCGAGGYFAWFFIIDEYDKITIQIAGISVVIVVLIIIKSTHIYLKGLSFIGTISYSIYLLEAKAFTPVLRMNINNNILKTCVYLFILSFGIGVYQMIILLISKHTKRDKRSSVRTET